MNLPSCIIARLQDHEGRRLPPQRLPADGRASGARWMIERARAARRRARQPLRRRPPQRAGPLLPERPDARPPARRVGRPPGGALFLLPLWHPVLLAEQIGTLASIAQGPFVMQCALGGGAEQFDARRVDAHASVALRSRARHRAPPVRRRRGQHRLAVRDRAGPHRADPAAAARGVDRRCGRAAVDRAARLGDAFLIGPEATPAQVRELVGIYREACDRHGRTADTIAVRRDVHVGADDADATRVAGPIVDRGYRGFDPAAPVVGGVEPSRPRSPISARWDAPT